MSRHRKAKRLSQPPPELGKCVPVEVLTARAVLLGAAAYGLEELENHKEQV